MELMVIKLVPKSLFFSSILHATYIQVKESAKLRQVMQTILTLGNALNQGTARGMALYSVVFYQSYYYDYVS